MMEWKTNRVGLFRAFCGLFFLSFCLMSGMFLYGQSPQLGRDRHPQQPAVIRPASSAQSEPELIDLRHTELPKIGDPSAPMVYRSETFAQRYNHLLPEEQVGITIYENRNRSVVNIDTITVRQGAFYQQTAEGIGSGIVLSKDGVILTNFHVVKDADPSHIVVRLFDGSEYKAYKIGEDPSTDIALLKINAPSELIFPVEFADSSQLLVGQTVFAIGNPFGLERTMTRGIISSLNRSIESPNGREIKGVIQTDASINVGNSGGALFDTSGKLIGMNTAIASPSGDSAGVGFAIPVNTISRIANTLLVKGEVVRGDSGILYLMETPNGLIAFIEDGGPADHAGLRGGKIVLIPGRGYARVVPKEGMDLIVSVNGQKVRTVQEFIGIVEEHKPGDTVILGVIRNNNTEELRLQLR